MKYLFIGERPSPSTALDTIGSCARRCLAIGSCARRCCIKMAGYRRLAQAQAGLDEAADALEDIRRDVEMYAAMREADWHDGPEGRSTRRFVDEIDGMVSALRRMTLPDLEGLR